MATTAVQAVEKNITSVALADIQPSNYNPRKNFDETSLAELAESIRQQGVLQPIGVRPIADNRFEIVFGERRYRASLMAELAEIPAIVMEISDETAEEMAITENLQRKDVTPIEEANAYQKLIDSGRHDVDDIVINTYEDHRMAMAFAPASITFPGLKIDNPQVVSKSYPHFWDDLRQAGFIIDEAE